MLNTLTMDGYLMRNIHLSENSHGTLKAFFRIASREDTKDYKGKHEYNVPTCVIYGNEAKNLRRESCKGSFINIQGRIRTIPITDPRTGKGVDQTFIHVDKFHMIESPAITQKRREEQLKASRKFERNPFYPRNNSFSGQSDRDNNVPYTKYNSNGKLDLNRITNKVDQASTKYGNSDSKPYHRNFHNRVNQW